MSSKIDRVPAEKKLAEPSKAALKQAKVRTTTTAVASKGLAANWQCS